MKTIAIMILACFIYMITNFILAGCAPKWSVPITVHKNEKQEQAK